MFGKMSKGILLTRSCEHERGADKKYASSTTVLIGLKSFLGVYKGPGEVV
jgi:hypothetical protein